MKTINEQYLHTIKDVESIYAIRIKNGVPYFVGWGEETSSGKFRIAQSAIPIKVEDIKCKMPNDAILESKGWEYTPTYCNIDNIDTLIAYTDEQPYMFSLTVNEFQSIIDILKDADYIFVFEDNTINGLERKSA